MPIFSFFIDLFTHGIFPHFSPTYMRRVSDITDLFTQGMCTICSKLEIISLVQAPRNFFCLLLVCTRRKKDKSQSQSIPQAPPKLPKAFLKLILAKILFSLLSFHRSKQVHRAKCALNSKNDSRVGATRFFEFSFLRLFSSIVGVFFPN